MFGPSLYRGFTTIRAFFAVAADTADSTSHADSSTGVCVASPSAAT
jgi:hypothetical protein